MKRALRKYQFFANELDLLIKIKEIVILNNPELLCPLIRNIWRRA